MNYSSVFAATTRVPNLAVSSARRSKPVTATMDSQFGAVIAAPPGTDPLLWSVLSASERRQVIDGDSSNVMIFGLMKHLVADIAA